MSKDLKHLSTRVSLVILACGFSSLGCLSLVSRAQKSWAFGSELESDCCCLGSVVSIIAGMIFLATACVYWRRRGETSRFAASDTHSCAAKEEVGDFVFPVEEQLTRDYCVFEGAPANPAIACGSGQVTDKRRKLSVTF
jgi:hypothetical protein